MTVVTLQPKVSKGLPQKNVYTSPVASPYHSYNTPLNNNTNNSPTKTKTSISSNTSNNSLNYNYIIVAGIVIAIILLS